MTNEPEPNTRAGEVFPTDNFRQPGEWPDPTPEMLETVLFDTIWRAIKTWDVNVPHAYSGYMGATGNHARAIYDAVVPMLTRPLPQPSEMVPRDVAESWKTKAENYQIERAELLADISDMMANHVANWPSPQKLKTAVALIDKTFHAQSAQIAKLQADGDKLAASLERQTDSMAFVLNKMSTPRQWYVKFSDELKEDRQALTEWKDRA